VLEFGAGTGKLALTIMNRLAELDCLPEQYLILEPSPDLQQRQQAMLAEALPDYFERFSWLSGLPAEFTGVVLANEVLDAMPVHLFKTDGDAIRECHVALNKTGDLVAQFQTDIQPELQHWWDTTGRHLGLPDDYMSEVNLAMPAWIKSLAAMLSQGLIILLDYGFPRHEYYLAERFKGTLKCHYRHHHHDDPLVLLGLQDITAHVDFTAAAESAHDNGLDVLGYVNQGGFLTSCGIVQLAEQQLSGDLAQQLKLSQEIKPLIMPDEMGELFKVLTLGKGIEPTEMGGLLGYQFMDLRQQL
jgi:SAM-dependent MidA family methyltransferase